MVRDYTGGGGGGHAPDHSYPGTMKFCAFVFWETQEMRMNQHAGNAFRRDEGQ